MVKITKDIVADPLELSESDFTLTQNTANVESKIAEHQVPYGSYYSFRAGQDTIFIKLFSTATGNPQITTGKIRIYKTDAKERQRSLIAEGRVTVFAEEVDVNKMYFIRAPVVLRPTEKIIVTYEGSETVAQNLTQIRMTGVETRKVLEL